VSLQCSGLSGLGESCGGREYQQEEEAHGDCIHGATNPFTKIDL